MNLKSKFILVCFLSFVSNFESRAQSYIPMLNDSLFWDVAYYDMNVIICSEFGNQGSGPYRYALDGDTTINGTIYKKFKSYSFFTLLPQPSPNCSPFAIDTIPSPSWNIFSFMREDTVNKIVYKYDTFNAQEYLWYNFDAQIGDTITYPELGIFIVDTIYNIITLDGKTRKYFGCNNAASNLCAFYIEGLGGKAGPFHDPFDIFEFGPWLMCIGDLNQTPIYSPFGISYCYNFTTNIESIIDNASPVSIFPNPVESNLKFDNLPLHANILIFDSYGKQVADYEHVNYNNISTSSLIPGLYFVYIYNDKAIFSIGKFIKQ
jgi:hypothetical protein